jgi:hypothetical protein
MARKRQSDGNFPRRRERNGRTVKLASIATAVIVSRRRFTIV